ncbi:MAG: hypothetical protein BroJett040_01730 [Oligoflexia bacterium]|nr:MAG: hypothetical protein BroJett040_01730 [Oligoflexia bacterium]
MKSMKTLILFVVFSVFSFSAQAKLICSLSESIQDHKADLEFEMPLTEGRGQLLFSSLAGVKTQGDMKIENGISTIRVLDSKTNRYLTSSSKVSEGSFSRIMVVPPAQTADSVEIDCRDSAEIPVVEHKQIDCVLTEQAGSAKFETPFTAPVATNGHDIFELPKAKLANISGWIIGYQGALILFMMNEKHDFSATGMGLLSGSVGLSWYPSEQNIRVDLKCQGIAQ